MFKVDTLTERSRDPRAGGPRCAAQVWTCFPSTSIPTTPIMIHIRVALPSWGYCCYHRRLNYIERAGRAFLRLLPLEPPSRILSPCKQASLYFVKLSTPSIQYVFPCSILNYYPTTSSTFFDNRLQACVAAFWCIIRMSLGVLQKPRGRGLSITAPPHSVPRMAFRFVEC